MKAWRWFVGQVTRLRRSIVGVFAPDTGRAGEHFASADEPAAGPPEHWVARVRRGAPGLLEPSLRRRGEPAGPPVADRLVRSQAELEPQPDSFEERERDPCRQSYRSGLGGRKPRPGPRCCGRFCDRRSPSANPCRHRSGLCGRKPRPGPRCCGRFYNEAVPRRLFPPRRSTVRPRRPAERIPLELHAETRQVGESADSPAGEPRPRRRSIDETEPTPTHPSAPVAGQPERSPRPTEVVEFEAPAQRLAARAEREASPARQIRAGVPRQSAENALRAELAVDEISIERVWERAVPPPAPRRESNVEPLREPAVPRPASQRESSAEPGPSPRSRAEPLSAGDIHPWPELPPPLDQADSDVEAALRAWDHQQRLDHEQTRL